jgi:hypothetical protein
MGDQSICIPGAQRRQGKWRAIFRRNKHLFVWIAAVLCLVMVLGYGVLKLLRQKTDADVVSQQGVVISPQFYRKK